MLLRKIIMCFCMFCVVEINAKKILSKDGYFSQHDLCEYEIAKMEREHGIPNGLLMAIGVVESGRTVSNREKRKRPWPWTICANGKGYCFSTKRAAIATTKKLIARGIRNIDVGCMQVNLLHHSRAFKNLQEAFTPKNNVAYAAKFLKSLKNATNSWTHAVGYYHSRAPKYYTPYCSLVLNEWHNVKGRQVNMSPRVRLASSEVKSSTFLPPYYSLFDKEISDKLHKLGRKTITRKPPKFFTNIHK